MENPPRGSYLVCATQRSGSTLLCETLRVTGVAGNPLEHFQARRATGRPPQPREYFAGLQDAEVLDLLAPDPPPDPDDEPSRDWWERVLAEGLTDNGVWGGKLMWDQVADLNSHGAEILGDPSVTLRETIDRLLGGPRLIFVTREERVDQAVSLWKAVQTQEWREGEGETKAEPCYSFAGIRHLAEWLEAGDRSWRRWFAAEGVQPLVVGYESLIEDPPGKVGEVLGFLGLPGVEVPEPPLERQRDETNQEWADRYRAEAAVAA